MLTLKCKSDATQGKWVLHEHFLLSIQREEMRLHHIYLVRHSEKIVRGKTMENKVNNGN